MLSRALIACALLAAEALAQGYQTKFDSAEGWILFSSHGQVQWAVDGNALAPLSAPSCLNYNNGVDYASGGRNYGYAISPLIHKNGRTTLRFWCNYVTETEENRYDQRFLLILDKNLKTVHAFQFAGKGPSVELSPCPSMNAWHDHTMELTYVSVSEFRVAFYFDTVDGWENNFAGWYIDDFSVTTEAPPKPHTIWQEDFEGNTAAWSLSGQGDVVWAVDATPPIVGAGGEASVKSGSKSLNFNNGSNYNGTAPTKGAAVSPPVNLTGMPAPELRFWCNYDTRFDKDLDRRILEIRGLDGQMHGKWHLVPEGAPGGEAAVALNCPKMGAWHQHTVPMQAAWGVVRLHFVFDSVNATSDNKAGWFVDAIAVENVKTSHHEGREGADPFCAVATAAFGPGSVQVGALISFRENYLRTASAGEAFWATYRRDGELVAEPLGRNPAVRGLLSVVAAPAAPALMALLVLGLGIAFVRRGSACKV